MLPLNKCCTVKHVEKKTNTVAFTQRKYETMAIQIQPRAYSVGKAIGTEPTASVRL